MMWPLRMPLALAACMLMLVSAPAALAQETAEAPLTVGVVAPHFDINTLEGTPVKLSDWYGRVVVLNFFMTSYKGTAEHLQVTEGLATKYATAGLKVLSISLQPGETGPATTKSFVDEHEIAHPVAADPDQKIARIYGVYVPLPAIFVIGRDGKIVSYQEGSTEGAATKLEQAIANALGTAVPAGTETTEEQPPPEETAEGAPEEEPVCHCFKEKEE